MIEFPNLMMLSLFNNKIESLEGIDRVCMPLLKSFYVSKQIDIKRHELYPINRYAEEKVLALLENYQSKYLSLSNIGKNKIKNLSALSSFPAIPLGHVHIEYHSSEEEQCCNVSILAKLRMDKNCGRICKNRLSKG